MATPEYDPTEVVGVMREHLQEAWAALDWALGYQASLDLADRYRQGKPTVQASRLSALLERSHRRMAGYLQTEDEDDGTEIQAG